MKKYIILAVVLLVIAGGGGYYYYRNQAPAGVTPIDEIPSGGVTVGENNTLLGWLKRGQELDCHLVTPDFQDIIVLTKGDKIRIDGSLDMFGQKDVAEGWYYVADPEWVHIWSDKKGIKISAADLAGLNDGVETEADIYSWESMAQAWQDDGIKFECKEAKLSDLLFKAPAEVEFTDMSAMLGELDRLKESLPAGPGDPATGANADIDLDELKNIMEGAQVAE